MNIELVDENEVIIDGVSYIRETDSKIDEDTIKEKINEKEPKFKEGDKVFSIGTNDEHLITEYTFMNSGLDQFNISIGNIFATREEAEAAIAKLQAMAKFNEKADAVKDILNENIDNLSNTLSKQMEKITNLFKED